jgi:hypothetical protein
VHKVQAMLLELVSAAALMLPFVMIIKGANASATAAATATSSLTVTDTPHRTPPIPSQLPALKQGMHSSGQRRFPSESVYLVFIAAVLAILHHRFVC